MRKLAREAVIFMLASAVLAGVFTAVYELYQRHKVIVESIKADEQYRLQTAQASKPVEAANPAKEHRVWIYVDVAQEFDGSFVEHPHPPSQIAKLVKDGVHCLPGSVTWAPDNVEWVCVATSAKPANYNAGDIILFDMTKATPVASGQMGSTPQLTSTNPLSTLLGLSS